MNHAWVVTGCRYHASYLSRWRLNYASYAHEPSFFLRGYPYDRAVNNHREMRKRNLKQKRFGVWEGNHLGLNLAKSWFKPSVYTKISSRCCPCGLQRDLQRQRIGRQPVLSFDRFSRGWGEAQSLFFLQPADQTKKPPWLRQPAAQTGADYPFWACGALSNLRLFWDQAEKVGSPAKKPPYIEETLS